MGQLVFQATLGGQVNLVGPNTASTYNLNVPAVSATLATTDANTFTATQTISSGNFTLSGTGQRITGDFSNATVANRVMFQNSVANGRTNLSLIPNGTSTISGVDLYSSSSDPANSSLFRVINTGTENQLLASVSGTGTALPMTFYTGGSERMRVDTSGNVGIGLTNPGAKLAVFSGSSPNIATLQIGYSGSNNYYDANLHSFRNGSQSEVARIDSSGNLLVGRTTVIGSDLPLLSVNGGGAFYTAATATTALTGFHNPNGRVGYIATSGSTTTYNTSSDYRLKENVHPMTGALSKVAALKPVSYTWKATGQADEGFIAHELQEVIPQAVTGEKDAVDADGNPVYQGIDTSFLVATLTAAIQEQQALITTLTARLDAANL